MRGLAFALGIGTSMAVLVALGTVGGRWLDGAWGTQPVFTVFGLLLGLAAGMYVLVRQVGALESAMARGPGRGGGAPRVGPSSRGDGAPNSDDDERDDEP